MACGIGQISPSPLIRDCFRRQQIAERRLLYIRRDGSRRKRSRNAQTGEKSKAGQLMFRSNHIIISSRTPPPEALLKAKIKRVVYVD